MNPLKTLVGRESGLDRVGAALRQHARAVRAPVVGGYQLTCSDETEWETASVFQRLFAQQMLPPLESGHRSVFRSVNLGGQYEWGAIGLAEQHYATPASEHKFKLMVAKINSHVAIRQTPHGPEFGWLKRYDRDSACCGALTSALEGGDVPAVRQLQQAFRVGGKDRLQILGDSRQVPTEHRVLLAAVTNARIQAARTVVDIRQHRPLTPTVYQVIPCVTLNRAGPSTELVVGEYRIDWTGSEPAMKYEGLGDDPAKYRIEYEEESLRIWDHRWPGE